MRTVLLSIFGIAAMALAGCETATPNSPANRVGLRDDAQTALRQMTSQDSKLQDVINSGYAYAIFPDVGKASLGVGGASGKGVVYQNAQPVGTVKLDQVSLGPQAGGETYSELIVFQNQDAFNRLVNNSLEFGAQASATLVKAGAAAGTHFEQGVAVYILPKGGLEVGANINGQKFTYMPNSGGM